MLGEDSVQTHNCNTNILLSIVGRDLPRDAERQEVRADGGGAGHPRAARPPAAARQPAARPRDVPRRAVHRAGTVLYCSVLYCTVLYCTVLYCTVLYCTVLYNVSVMRPPAASSLLMLMSQKMVAWLGQLNADTRVLQL